MSMSSVSVVTNALRLRGWRPAFRPEEPEPEKAPAVALAAAPEAAAEPEVAHQWVIGVEGMMCGHCTARVEKALKAVPGVVTAAADVKEKTARVTGEGLEAAALEKAVTDAGYQVLSVTPPREAPVSKKEKEVMTTIVLKERSAHSCDFSRESSRPGFEEALRCRIQGTRT